MQKGVVYALASAVLFGMSTPVAKALVGALSPLVLACLLYAGSGIGLLFVLVGGRLATRNKSPLSLPRRKEWKWLAGGIFFGGVAGPILLMYGLVLSTASSASLLLNLESVFTALLAWFLFRENFDRRIAIGMLAIVAGGVLLSWNPESATSVAPGMLLIAGACLCWALDNNLTRRVSAGDAVVIAGLKGLVAGAINLILALILGQTLPPLSLMSAAAVLGFLGYGISLVLFVLALRNLGTARAGAYFSVAPFFGAALAILLFREAVTWQLIAAGTLMAVGVWLHLTEKHEHRHTHEFTHHVHEHEHDTHHRHEHDFSWDDSKPHAHAHAHEPVLHSHPHFPDIHHRHDH